jgi:hypothetical protein
MVVAAPHSFALSKRPQPCCPAHWGKSHALVQDSLQGARPAMVLPPFSTATTPSRLAFSWSDSHGYGSSSCLRCPSPARAVTCSWARPLKFETVQPLRKPPWPRPRRPPQGAKHTIQGGLVWVRVSEKVLLRPGTNEQVPAKPVSPKACCGKASRLNNQALTEMPPAGFEPATGCLEDLRSLACKPLS